MSTATPAALADKLSPLPAPSCSPAWRHAKAVLRLTSSSLAIVVAIQSIQLLPIPIPLTSPLLPLTLAVACISWNATVLVMVQLKKVWMNQARSMHIVIETVLWVAGLAATAMQTVSLTLRGKDVQDKSISSRGWALTGTLAPLFILHLILFIRACTESSHRKKKKQVRQLKQTLIHENERGFNFSIPSPSSHHYQGPQSPESNHDNLYMGYRVSPISELSTPSVFAELPAFPAIVELPGDYGPVHHAGKVNRSEIVL